MVQEHTRCALVANYQPLNFVVLVLFYTVLNLLYQWWAPLEQLQPLQSYRAQLQKCSLLQDLYPYKSNMYMYEFFPTHSLILYA